MHQIECYRFIFVNITDSYNRYLASVVFNIKIRNYLMCRLAHLEQDRCLYLL
jgi:hypothetical protein